MLFPHCKVFNYLLKRFPNAFCCFHVCNGESATNGIDPKPGLDTQQSEVLAWFQLGFFLASESLEVFLREGKPPASKSVIRDLPTTVVEAGRDCSICTEEFDTRLSATLLPCRHLFHRQCIVPWLEVVRAISSSSSPLLLLILFSRFIEQFLPSLPP